MEATLTNLAVEILAPVAASLATALVSWAMVEVSRYVRQKTSNEKAISAVDRLCHTVTSTVAELEQVVVPALRAKAADGSLSKTDRQRLKKAAIRLVRRRLVPEIEKNAGRVVADIDSFLEAKIEQAVLQLKRDPGEAMPLIEAVSGERNK